VPNADGNPAKSVQCGGPPRDRKLKRRLSRDPEKKGGNLRSTCPTESAPVHPSCRGKTVWPSTDKGHRPVSFSQRGDPANELDRVGVEQLMGHSRPQTLEMVRRGLGGGLGVIGKGKPPPVELGSRRPERERWNQRGEGITGTDGPGGKPPRYREVCPHGRGRKKRRTGGKANSYHKGKIGMKLSV